MVKLKLVLLLIISLIVFSCSKTFKNSKQCLEYINNEKNGLIQFTQVDNLTFSLKYLPVQYLTLKEIEQNQEYETLSIQKKDSILRSYGENLTFLFSVSEENGNTQQFDTIRSSMKTDLLDSESKSAFQLYVDGRYLDPVLQTVEFDGGLGKSYNYYLVFPHKPNAISAKEIKVIFNDRYLTSKNIEFNFLKSDIENIPSIDF